MTDILSGFTRPETPEKPARKTRAKKVVENTLTRRLLTALEFLSLAQKPSGKEQLTYCFMGNGQAIAFDGIVAVGLPIELDIYCAPRTRDFRTALAACYDSIVATQLDAQRLHLASGDFQAVIPCINPATLTAALPDAPCGAVDGRLTEALSIVEPLASDKAQHVTTACVMLRAGSVVGTNGDVILEAWHGIDLPPNLLIPKAALVALRKAKKLVCSFGFSPTTLTFHFTDGSWLRTQLYVEKYAAVDGILNSPGVYHHAVPGGFLEAVALAGKFSADGNVYCESGRIGSHSLEDTNLVGARKVIDFPGLQHTRIYNVSSVAIMAKYAEWMDDTAREGTTFFGRENVRGAIGHKTVRPAVPTIQGAVETANDDWDHCRHHESFHPDCQACEDENIPF